MPKLSSFWSAGYLHKPVLIYFLKVFLNLIICTTVLCCNETVMADILHLQRILP